MQYFYKPLNYNNWKMLGNPKEPIIMLVNHALKCERGQIKSWNGHTLEIKESDKNI